MAAEDRYPSFQAERYRPANGSDSMMDTRIPAASTETIDISAEQAVDFPLMGDDAEADMLLPRRWNPLLREGAGLSDDTLPRAQRTPDAGYPGTEAQDEGIRIRRGKRAAGRPGSAAQTDAAPAAGRGPGAAGSSGSGSDIPNLGNASELPDAPRPRLRVRRAAQIGGVSARVVSGMAAAGNGDGGMWLRNDAVSNIMSLIRRRAAKAGTIPLKALAVKIGIPILILLLILTMIVAATPTIFTPGGDEDAVSDTYAYITELDADTLLDIRSAAGGGPVLINGTESNSDAIQIYTNADYLILYFTVHYGDTRLDSEIDGFFGGATVRDEIKRIHDALYSWETISTTGEDDAGESVTVSGVSVRITPVAQYLSETGALTEDDQAQIRDYSEFGLYTTLQSLGDPFDGHYYIKDRWGWYITPDGQKAMRSGVVLQPFDSNTVISCVGGTVESVTDSSVTVKVGSTDTILYAQLDRVYVAAGQSVPGGTELGKASYVSGLYLEYRRDDHALNPGILLPISSVTSGDGSGIVEVAATQLGNVGGQPYWSWYGFGGRVPWCACFVSWCANECGYIDAGIIPKYASCDVGRTWFQAHGQWQGPGSYVPQPGDIIFFDWDHAGQLDHTGIVEYCDGSTVHTIEGNTSNSVARRTYSIYNAAIVGYGTPVY